MFHKMIVGLAAFALFALSATLAWLAPIFVSSSGRFASRTPRSIFETRRVGLA